MKNKFAKLILPAFMVTLLMLVLPSCEKKNETDNGKSGQTPAKTGTDMACDSCDSNPQNATDVPTPAPAGMVPVDVTYPAAVFVGTPANLSTIPNLEAAYPEGYVRPPIMAPKGTVNLARGKVVTGTDEDPIIGELAMLTDGDKEATDGSYVEFGPGKQYYTVDLGQKSNIYGIIVWHYHKTQRVYNDVIVQTADDPDFIENVQTLFNNDIDNSAGLGVGTDKSYIDGNKGKLIDGKGTQAQYVRFYSNGSNENELNHYIEIAVYGTPVQ
ncbi:MAG: hypothetical protein K9M57_01485 [Phycisphaerae bacterium]|nr:hypothetical protein [Phycisphaerae bacterium]